MKISKAKYILYLIILAFLMGGILFGGTILSFLLVANYL